MNEKVEFLMKVFNKRREGHFRHFQDKVVKISVFKKFNASLYSRTWIIKDFQ